MGSVIKMTPTRRRGTRRRFITPIAAMAVPLAIALAGCGSSEDSTTESAAASSTAAESGSSTTTCPSAPPAESAAPEWTLPGATGSVAVTGSTDTAAPRIEVTTPFSVDATQVRTLRAGDGQVVPDTATVSVCYEGVNGRDGALFDSSYQSGKPVQFPLDGVVPGFQKAIAGQKVGSTVAVAVAPADGYPQGQPAAGIQQGDTLVFAIKILAAQG
ncbi:FKBP-type peptidyl-prolyl cis-trans isomerase [Gordonia sinesedis]